MATLSISGTLVLTRSSKIVNIGAQSAGNQRRYVSSLVETSETTRATSYSKNFSDWLAGVIDGEGCLLVSKKRAILV